MRMARELNDSFQKQPLRAVASVVACEIATIYGTHLMLTLAGVQVGSAFAMAFAINRTLRRLKTPVDLVLAAALSRAFPAFSAVKLTPMLDLAYRRLLPGSVPGPALVRVRAILDQYGASYFVAARWSGVISTCVIYACLSQGVDIDSMLEWLGASKSAGAVLGTWAAAVVGSAAAFPLTVYIGGAVLAPRLGRTLGARNSRLDG
jgi:hypothetical protein